MGGSVCRRVPNEGLRRPSASAGYSASRPATLQPTPSPRPAALLEGHAGDEISS